jgi:hypothetical protein
MSSPKDQIMTFTSQDLRSIEQTMDKLETVAHTMWNRETTDGANARYIAQIIREMRLCADLMQSTDRTTRLEAADRLVHLITQ